MRSTAVVLVLSFALASSALAAEDPTSPSGRAEAASAAAKMAVEAAEAAEKAARAARAAADQAVAAAATAASAAGQQPGFKTSTNVATKTEAAASASAGGNRLNLSTYLTANSDGGNATVKLAGRKTYDSGDVVYSGALSSPLAKDSKFTEPATLDGLANGANLTLSAGKFLIKPRDEDTPVWSIGTQARLGYATFKYLNPTSTSQESTHRYTKSVAPYVGFNPGAQPIFVIAKYEYQRTFKDADQKVLCPEAITFPVTCAPGALGEPKRVVKRLWSLSLRYTGELFDIAPTATYDRAAKVKGLDVPIYFIKSGGDEKNIIPFNAGVRLGWRSDTKDASIGVFVGSPFSLYGP